MTSKMKMQLFGSFCLENEFGSLDEEKLHSNKLTRLLAFFVIHRDKVLSHQKLIETFWEDDSKNPQGALKNLMYRLRTAMKVFGDEDFICTMSGAYRWNPDIVVETDYEQFEQLASEIRTQKDEQKKKEMCKIAISAFQGSVSPKIAGETWILSKITWYQSLYMDIAKELASIYEKEGDWDELEALCTKALIVDSMDEDMHYWVLKSLYGQNKYDLAIVHYEKVSKMLYDSLGIRSPEKLQSVFQEVVAAAGGKVVDITNLMTEVCEAEKPDGAFFCDYQVFRQIYRVEARRMKRSGMAENILLLTVRYQGGNGGNTGADDNLIYGMDILEKLLKKSLRVGDVAARYSMTQFLVLLPTCSYEAGVMVASRLKKNFAKSVGRRRLELVYELEELLAAE